MILLQFLKFTKFEFRILEIWGTGRSLSRMPSRVLLLVRLMYWTDVSEQSPKIEYSWMTGEERQTLVSERLVRPTGLAVDYYKNHRVYWCDTKENAIESVNHDGTDRAFVIRSGESQ